MCCEPSSSDATHFHARERGSIWGEAAVPPNSVEERLRALGVPTLNQARQCLGTKGAGDPSCPALETVCLPGAVRSARAGLQLGGLGRWQSAEGRAQNLRAQGVFQVPRGEEGKGHPRCYLMEQLVPGESLSAQS